MALAIGCAQGAGHCAERTSGGSSTAYDAIIAKHAQANGVPERLIRRIIVRESRYNPSARNGGHYGMMQIKPGTAKSMGYQGDAAGLLDADTNLTYGVRYLAGAYKVAGGDENRAVSLYASGYYYDAKRKGLLAAVGLGRSGKRETMVANAAPVATPQVAVATVPVPQARDAVVMAAAAPAPKPSFFLFGRTPAKTTAPASAPVAAESPVVTASAVPLPPVRGAVPVGPTVAAAQNRVVMAAAVPPLPPVRPAMPIVVASNEPQSPIVASAPLPPARDLAAATARKPRVIATGAEPVLASAFPVAPTAKRATPPAQALGFAAPQYDDTITGSLKR